MKSKPRIVIITSSDLRHRYFANFLTTQVNVLGIVAQTNKLLEDHSEKIVKKHFKERDQKENYYFKGNKKFNARKVLFVLRKETNSYKVLDWIVNLKPDFLVIYGTNIIKDPVLGHFRNKTINMHLGLSPYYRGTATNFWALVNKEPECVGATIHIPVLEPDAGPILAQARPLNPKVSDRNHDLGCKTVIAGTKLMAKVLKEYNKITPQIQSKKGISYKRKDFNAHAVLKMWNNFDTGMMKEYLENKELRDKQYPICSF